MEKTDKLRIGMGTFDLLKGLLIILVVVAHSRPHYDFSGAFKYVLKISDVLMAYGAMPAFYMIAGVGFRPKRIKVMLKKTADDLLKPYMITGIFVTILFPIIYYIRTAWMPAVIQETPHWVLAYVLGVSTAKTYVFGYQIYECYVVWFLPTMFIALNLLNAILKIKKLGLRHFIVMICVFSGLLLAKIGIVYFYIAQGMVALGFCYIGYCVKENGFLQQNRKSMWIYVLLCLGWISRLNHRPFSIAYINETGNILDYVGAVCSALLLVILFIRIANTRWNPPDWLVKAGMYSPWIVCIHAVELSVFPWHVLQEIIPFNDNVNFLIEMLLKFLIIFPGCIIIKKIMQRRLKMNQKNMRRISND